MQPRDIQIPLFLWIATAILVHLFWGGSTHQVALVVEERASLRNFAAGVQREVQAELRPIPIAMLESDVTTPPKPAEPEEVDEPSDTEPKAKDIPDEKQAKKKAANEEAEKKEKEKKKEEEKEKPKPPDEKEPKPEAPIALLPEDKKQLDAPAEKPKEETPQLELEKKRAIAIRQHVEDKNQADNPDAKFLADEANKVAEETQAKITSTDQDDPKPKAGAGSSEEKPSEQPGNSDTTRVASAFGDNDEGSALPSPHVEEPKTSSQANRPETALQTPEQKAADARSPNQAAAPKPADPGQKPQEIDPGAKASPEIVADSEGNYSLGGSSVARPKKKRLPPMKATKPNDWFGLGSGALTSSGINLNLSHADAVAVVGEKQIQEDRRMDRLRRRSQRAGAWKKVGLERWRSAIENYVPSVKPGNTTALNAAKAPFATYLNDIHNRIHPIFADDYLGSLGRLPAGDPQNRQELVAHAEIVLSKDDGSLVRAGIVRHSGVTAFDVSALESILQASPYGKPPEAILSPDGNVYLHWEFYRNPDYACSTYFAHPFILKSAPSPSQPKPDSPKEPDQNPLPGPRIPPNMLVPTHYSPGPRPNLPPATG
jgi:hypothetical protein